jgi:hypothetical protein
MLTVDASTLPAHGWRARGLPDPRELRSFASSIGASGEPGSLVVIGTPRYEPWHFVAHLSEQADRSSRIELKPRLARWVVPANAPEHLSLRVADVATLGRRHSLLVIEPDDPPAALLERVWDAKRKGLRVLTMHRGSRSLIDMSHETLAVDPRRPFGAFDVTEHLVTVHAPLVEAHRWWNMRRLGLGFRARGSD